ncbi:MAG: dihydroorotase [Candidatus Kapaibacterium sp.]|jgi:dihydroorotase
MNILFENIRLIDPVQKIDKVLNLHILDGKIHKISEEAIKKTDDMQIIEASHLVAAPGFIDMHVHLRDPGFSAKETIATGVAAAANGGFTELVCMPNTSPAIDSLPIVYYINKKAENLPVTVKIAATITKDREGLNLSPMLELNEAGVVYFTDDGSCVCSAEVMKRAFNFATPNDLLLAQHCEEHSLTKNFSVNESETSIKLGLKGYPNIAEEIIIQRDLKLSEYTGNRRYHIQHISTRGAVDLVRDAKNKGLRVSTEVTPHHIYFTDEKIQSYDINFKMNPPLRQQEDIDAIIAGIKDGTIDCIASDHAPHSQYERDVEFENVPNGVIGLETTLGAVLTKLHHQEKIELNKIIELLAINPRKIMKMEQVKIAENETANLTIFAPNEEWIVKKEKFKSKAINSPFIDEKFIGKPKFIINNNKFIASEL